MENNLKSPLSLLKYNLASDLCSVLFGICAQVLAGGIGRPKAFRIMYTADKRPLEEVSTLRNA